MNVVFLPGGGVTLSCYRCGSFIFTACIIKTTILPIIFFFQKGNNVITVFIYINSTLNQQPFFEQALGVLTRGWLIQQVVQDCGYACFLVLGLNQPKNKDILKVVFQNKRSALVFVSLGYVIVVILLDSKLILLFNSAELYAVLSFCLLWFSFFFSEVWYALWFIHELQRKKFTRKKKMFWNIYLMEWQETENGYTYAI